MRKYTVVINEEQRLLLERAIKIAVYRLPANEEIHLLEGMLASLPELNENESFISDFTA